MDLELSETLLVLAVAITAPMILTVLNLGITPPAAPKIHLTLERDHLRHVPLELELDAIPLTKLATLPMEPSMARSQL
jgi:hypothetical protein